MPSSSKKPATAATERRWWSNLSLATLATVASAAVLVPFVGYLFHFAPLLRAGYSLEAAVAIYPAVAAASGFAILAVAALIVAGFALAQPTADAIWQVFVRLWAKTGRPTAPLERAAVPNQPNQVQAFVGLGVVGIMAAILLPVAFLPFAAFASALPRLAAPLATLRERVPALIGLGVMTLLIAIWLSPVDLATQLVVLETEAGVPSGPYVVLGEQGSWMYLTTCGSTDVTQVATRLVDSLTGPTASSPPPKSGTLVDWLSGRPSAEIVCDGRVVTGP
jgi:hypothetical protein